MKKSLKKKIVVFLGGKAVEREVSIITGLQTINNLNPFVNEVYPIYISEKGDWFSGDELKDISFYKNFSEKVLKKVCILPNSNCLFAKKGKSLKIINEIDFAINCTHGGGGEGGDLSGAIAQSNITSISPPTLASAISMDKVISKLLFSGLNLDVLPYLTFIKSDFEQSFQKIKQSIKAFGYPVIIKPCSLGSSIGINICKNEKELKQNLYVAFNFDFNVIVEKALTNFDELFCSCFGNEKNVFVSDVERIERTKMLSFEEKYIYSTKREFPAKIEAELKQQVQTISKLVFKTLKCLGIIRIDFLFDKTNNKLFINEANIIPGSLAFAFWKNKFEFSELLEKLKECGEEQNALNKQFVYDFRSNILDNYLSSTTTKLK